MRIFVSIILALFLITWCVPDLCAQEEVKVTLNFEDVTLNSALLQIHRKYRVDMAYNSKVFKKYRVTQNFNSVDLSKALKLLIQPFGYDFVITNEVYIFFEIPEEEKELDPQKFNFEYSSFILDGETQEKLPYAKVKVSDSNSTAITDENGYFYFFNLPSDTCTLEISYVGYELKKVKLNPTMVSENMPIEIEKNSKVMAQIPVYGFRSEMISLDPNSDALEIDVKSARVLPDLGELDIFRLAQFQTGTNGTGERSGQLNIRGGEADESLILLDGFTIYHTDHFYNLYSAINANAVKHMQIYKGFFESKYGGRTAGVIEITGKEGNGNYKESQVDLNFTSLNLFFESPLPGTNSTIAIAARRSFTDVINTPLFRDLFNNVYNQSISKNGDEIDVFQSGPPDYNFSDVNVKYTSWLSARDKINLSFYLSDDNLLFQYDNEFPEIQETNTFLDNSSWGNKGASIRWSRLWSARFNTKLSLGLSNYQSNLFAEDVRTNNFFQTTTITPTNQSFSLNDLNAVYHNEWFVKNHRLNFGLSFNGMGMEQVSILEGLRTTENQQGGVSAFFVQDEYNFKKFNFNLGFRTVNYANKRANDLNNWYFEPRASVKYRMSKMLTWQLAYTQNNQFIRRLSEQDLFRNTPDIWSLSNDNTLPVLRSKLYTLGAHLQWDFFEIKIESFYKDLQGTIYNLDNIPLYFEAQSASPISKGKKEVGGLEFSIFKTKGKHKGWVGLTLNSIRNYDHDIIPYEFASDHDQLIEFKSAYSLSLKGWTFGAFFVYGSGRPYSPAIGIYNLELVNGQEQEVLAYENLNSARLPDYHRLDLSLTKHFLWPSSNQAEIGFSVFNVYNRTNISDVRYFVVGANSEESSIVDYNVNMLGILPSLKIKYTF